MIVKEFYKTRSDDVNLYRIYSDEGKQVLQNETGIVYDEAIDVENAPYTYSETGDPTELSAEEEGKFAITVTDPALIEKTGGIVQGMSGSPVIQNGRIVGAVTHVLINDPTRGYGIFIENMLEAAEQ